MSRSVWKGPFYEEHLLKKAEIVKNSGKTSSVIKIWTRKSTILPEFVGLTFGVYNGKKFIPVSVNESMVGHKFGEFSPTRTFNAHSAVKKTDTDKPRTPVQTPGTPGSPGSPGTPGSTSTTTPTKPDPKQEASPPPATSKEKQK